MISPSPVGNGHAPATAAELAPLPVVIEPGGQLPTRAYADDAGFDLYVAEDTTLYVGQFKDVPMGVRVELPPGVWGFLTGRSSTIRTRGLLVTTGIIDTGWRGPLFAGVQNIGVKAAVVKRGDRIAQLILLPAISALFTPVRVSQLSPSARGENGFGSTGS